MPSNPIQVLLQAAADNNIGGLRQKLAKTTISTQREALLLACKRNSINCITEINRLLPDLACIKDGNNNGYTVLQELIITDDLPVSVIEALIKYHPKAPQLCTEADYNECITPFHMAAEQGRADILKVLIKGCGSHSRVVDSLFRVTSLRQTAFHLALEHGQIGCFHVMMKELLKGDENQQSKSLRVLNLKDDNGNTVLHIAIARKQRSISGYLVADSPKRRPLVEANIKNNLGLTALQVLEGNSPERDDGRIRQLLVNEAVTDQITAVASLAISHKNSDTSGMTSLTGKTLIITVVAMVATMMTASLYSYRDFFKTEGQKTVPPHANLLTIMLLLPSGFFFLTVASSAFVLCMSTVLWQLWSINNQYWSTFGRPIVLFLFTAMLILFGLMVNELIPDFSVTAFGAHRISSLCLLGFYVVALLLTLLIIVFAAKRVYKVFVKE